MAHLAVAGKLIHARGSHRRGEELADHTDPGWLLPFIRALQSIVTGRRDRTLADAPELTYEMSAEILFLLETLAQPR